MQNRVTCVWNHLHHPPSNSSELVDAGKISICERYWLACDFLHSSSRLRIRNKLHTIPRMIAKPETYPTLYIIFTLLSAIRRGVARANIWREFRRQKITLKPRLVFWLALCKQAGLVDDYEGRLSVTRQARAWLNKTSEEQTFCLIAAWQDAPRNRKTRLFRKKLLWKLKYDKPLTTKDLGIVHELEALGLVSGIRLTKWGEFFIKDEGKLPTPKPSEPCKIQEDFFLARLPQHVYLLWELEKHLRPIAPGKYPLTKRALSFYNTDPYALIELLEKGLRAEIPARAKAVILNQPSIRIAEGIVLEFSSPAELAQLRRQPRFREYIDEFLSSQRVLVSSQKAKKLFEMLKRRGVYLHQEDEVPPERNRGRTHFPQKKILQPVGKSVSKLALIEKYQKLGQALDMQYRTPGYPAEQRRITPLSIEERGGQTYVIAYCQTRRGQRTFRLDRMEIPGTY
jgi:hypothetical protein